MNSIPQHTAWVTGASGAIGGAIARALARRGHPVVLWAYGHVASAEKTLGAIEREGGRGVCVCADLADADAVAEAAKVATTKLGPPLILAHAAGALSTQFLVMTRPEDWRRALAVNLDGAFHALHAVARGMLRARWGRVVLIGSVAGLAGDAMRAPYAAAKAGLTGLACSAARELAGAGITVNVVAPGPVSGPMTADLPAARKSRLLESIPMGRFGEPDEIASVVAFLVSDDAAYITGETLVVDGGMYLRR